MIICLTGTASMADSPSLPLREDSGLTKTEALLANANYSAAVESADDVLKRHENNADALTYKGYAYFMLGEKENARKYFEYALKVNPAHLGANKYMASLYIEEGELDRAFEQMQAVRMICGATDCEEARLIQFEINKSKDKKGSEK